MFMSRTLRACNASKQFVKWLILVRYRRLHKRPQVEPEATPDSSGSSAMPFWESIHKANLKLRFAHSSRVSLVRPLSHLVLLACKEFDLTCSTIQQLSVSLSTETEGILSKFANRHCGVLQLDGWLYTILRYFIESATPLKAAYQPPSRLHPNLDGPVLHIDIGLALFWLATIALQSRVVHCSYVSRLQTPMILMDTHKPSGS